MVSARSVEIRFDLILSVARGFEAQDNGRKRLTVFYQGFLTDVVPQNVLNSDSRPPDEFS